MSDKHTTAEEEREREREEESNGQQSFSRHRNSHNCPVHSPDKHETRRTPQGYDVRFRLPLWLNPDRFLKVILTSILVLMAISLVFGFMVGWISASK